MADLLAIPETGESNDYNWLDDFRDWAAVAKAGDLEGACVERHIEFKGSVRLPVTRRFDLWLSHRLIPT